MKHRAHSQVVMFATVVLLSVALTGCSLGQSAGYGKAQALYESGSFGEAYEAFVALEDYNDSPARARESATKAADESFASGDYRQAVVWYEVIGNDSLADAARWAYVSAYPDKTDPLVLSYLDELILDGNESAAALHDELYGWRVDLAVNYSYTDHSSSYSTLPMSDGDGSAVAQCVSYAHVSIENSPIFDESAVSLRVRCLADNGIAASDSKTLSFTVDENGTLDGQEEHGVVRFDAYGKRPQSFLVEIYYEDTMIWSKTYPCSY